MLSPLFFHSFRVDFQHSAWRIRHTNQSQLLMGIAQMVEELVQNKKNQLKPSKTWEKPAMNFAGWVDLPFPFLLLPSCKPQQTAPEVEMANSNQKIRNGERTSTVSESNLLFRINRAGWPWVIYMCCSLWVSSAGVSTWEKRHFDVPMWLFEKTRGLQMNWEKIWNILVWFIWVFIRKRPVI